jgi:hypothetical protein
MYYYYYYYLFTEVSSPPNLISPHPSHSEIVTRHRVKITWWLMTVASHDFGVGRMGRNEIRGGTNFSKSIITMYYYYYYYLFTEVSSPPNLISPHPSHSEIVELFRKRWLK